MDRIVPDSTKRITGAYGWIKLNGKPYNHKGVDIGWRTDENQNIIFCNCYGVVEYLLDGLNKGDKTGGGWGNYVLVRHPNGMYSRYCHLRKGLPVHIGQEVDETNMLGVMGESGTVTARHLHFEVQTNQSADSRIDPTPYLSEPIWKPEPQSNLKYRASTKEESWGEWKNAGDTAGSVGFGYSIDRIQIDSDEPIKVKASIQDTGWVDFGEINKYSVIG